MGFGLVLVRIGVMQKIRKKSVPDTLAKSGQTKPSGILHSTQHNVRVYQKKFQPPCSIGGREN